MRKLLLLPLFLLFIFSIQAQEQEEQSDSLRKNAVKIFIDCEYCDMNHIRREIPYVNYVRDIKEAQLYIREKRQQTGSGGSEYSFFFTGQEEFEGLTDTLIYTSRPDDTRDFTRDGRCDMMKMGLMRYVARTPIFKEVSIRHMGEAEEEEVSDRWNNWVFEMETRPRFESEESLKEFSFWNSFNANKITPEWKIEIGVDQRLTRTKYIYDNETNISDKTQIQFENLIVKSLGEHWSVGTKIELLTSTFNNAKFNADIFPTIEYNLFPYSESTHRQLRFAYGIGVSLNQYNDTTIYGKIAENLGQQQLQIAYQVQEKWGSINVSLEGSNYLHDFSKNRLELEGSISIRIIKGLSFSVRGRVAQIHDQLSLVGEELSEADILLQLTEMASSFNVDGSLGLTYTFGSIFNNVVNPRFGNGRRYYR
ncbi:MAG: hypothetical protein HN778_08390 [Prolixibacteraceae bacterium]|jgi:hypothetical protein|nr:hypothetical protein [Prolixibacteraceae bacterium]MBT6762909.1 hypothetical protein [Prolixibacteraceae bacterium]MBT6998986.1 hypothetical protein [Prolixibacteraceae bacterium]MBT7394835.1 hypothetical protein [Prolixibacteraceae bacterium]